MFTVIMLIKSKNRAEGIEQETFEVHFYKSEFACGEQINNSLKVARIIMISKED